MELEVRRRINKTIGEQKYWKWYIDIPSNYVTELDLKIGDRLKVTKVQ